MKNITIGQYVPGDSVVHRLDPRTKILLSLVFIISLFFVNNFTTYIFIFAVILMVTKLSKLSFSYLTKGLKGIIMLIVFTGLLNILFTRGAEPPLFRLGPVAVYREGIITALFMTMRLIFLIVGTSLLTLTTSPIELTDGIERLLKPFSRLGLPAHELAMMMSIALRFIPTLMDETDKIRKAQMARGADFESKNLIKKAKSLIPILVPLFVSSLRRAKELADAMEARCYRGGQGRTRMKELKYQRNDLIAFVSAVIYVGVLWFMNQPWLGLV